MSPLYVPPADGGGGTPEHLTWPSIIPWQAGRYYNSSVVLPGNGTTTATMNTGNLFVSPLRMSNAVTLDRIGVNVTTFGVAASLRMGIYAAGVDGLPGALLLDAGLLDASSNGLKLLTIALALDAGAWVYLVGVPSATIVVTGLVVTNHPSANGSTDGTAFNSAHLAVLSAAWGGFQALPSTFPAGAIWTSQCCAYVVRVGSVP